MKQERYADSLLSASFTAGQSPVLLRSDHFVYIFFCNQTPFSTIRFFSQFYSVHCLKFAKKLDYRSRYSMNFKLTTRIKIPRFIIVFKVSLNII